MCVCVQKKNLVHSRAAQAPFAPQRPAEEVVVVVVVAVEEKEEVRWSVGGQFPSLTGMNGMEQ